MSHRFQETSACPGIFTYITWSFHGSMLVNIPYMAPMSCGSLSLQKISRCLQKGPTLGLGSPHASKLMFFGWNMWSFCWHIWTLITNMKKWRQLTSHIWKNDTTPLSWFYHMLELCSSNIFKATSSDSPEERFLRLLGQIIYQALYTLARFGVHESRTGINWLTQKNKRKQIKYLLRVIPTMVFYLTFSCGIL